MNYNTIAEAESALRADGYSRDGGRAIWRNVSTGTTAKVEYDRALGKFFIKTN